MLKIETIRGDSYIEAATVRGIFEKGKFYEDGTIGFLLVMDSTSQYLIFKSEADRDAAVKTILEAKSVPTIEQQQAIIDSELLKQHIFIMQKERMCAEPKKGVYEYKSYEMNLGNMDKIG